MISHGRSLILSRGTLPVPSPFSGRAIRAAAGQLGSEVAVQKHLDSVETGWRRFAEDLQLATGQPLSCPPGCGRCCQSPTIESTPYECIPMARELMRQGMAEAVLERLEASTASPQCIMFEPRGPEQGQGRCSMYATRPLVCRLFGFAAVKDKNGTLDLAACAVMKETIPQAVAAAKEAIKQGRVVVPVFADEWSELHTSVMGTQHATVMPINQALKEALKDQLWKDYLTSMSEEGAGETGQR